MAGNMASLWAFYDAVTALVNRGRVTDITCLDFCRAFDTVPHHILVSVLDRHEFPCPMDHSLEKEMFRWSHSKGCRQWLDIQVETYGEWYSSGVSTGTS